MHRFRRCFRLCLYLLFAYVLLIAAIIFVFGYALQWSYTDRVVLALTPSFAQNWLATVLFNAFVLSPTSPHFGRYAHQLTPSEALRESAWMRIQRVSLESTSDCGNFAVPEGSGGTVQHELDAEERPHTELEVATALERWFSGVGASLTGGSKVETGGWFVPGDCQPRETLAIVVPYRDRFANLVLFLNYMHRFLQRQKRRYLLVVAEQANYNVSFNRAKLFNAAVRELAKLTEPRIDCFVLHDVDKLPYHLFNVYACGFQPRQLATAVGQVPAEAGGAVEWTPYYAHFLGAVTAFSRWQVLRMNGGSNIFYGWGGEDDDLALRAALAGYVPSTPGAVRGRMWVMGHHDDRKTVPNLYRYLTVSRVVERMRRDGLGEVRYRLLATERRPLYTLMSFHL